MLDNLSTRAQNILRDVNIMNFNNFFDIVVVKGKDINFISLRNCGKKTELELNYFVRSIRSLSDVFLFGDKNNDDKLLLNNKVRNYFDQKFASLSIRTKNILSSNDADTVRNFYYKIISNDNQKYFRQFSNCGKKTETEILIFKKNISEYINKTASETLESTVFADINMYFYKTNDFSNVEKSVLKAYLGLVNGVKKETHTSIAPRYDLTRERVRQISILLIKKIEHIVEKVYLNECYDMHSYFKEDCFYVDDILVQEINKNEQTSFNAKFITYVLYYLKNPNYEFIAINTHFYNFSGLFVKKVPPVDLNTCFSLLSKYFETVRKDDLIIEIDHLMNLCKRNLDNQTGQTYDIEKLIYRNNFINALHFFTKYLDNNKSHVEINADSIVIKRNKKKWKYQQIEDMLDEFKKPMHHTDLKKECLKRGIKIKSIIGNFQCHTEIFGLKGAGIYGLRKWGGYFGTIGDVSEQILNERNEPINLKELENILCRELCISQKSVKEVLFYYKPEDRFVKLKNGSVGLRKWFKENEGNK